MDVLVIEIPFDSDVYFRVGGRLVKRPPCGVTVPGLGQPALAGMPSELLSGVGRGTVSIAPGNIERSGQTTGAIERPSSMRLCRPSFEGRPLNIVGAPCARGYARRMQRTSTTLTATGTAHDMQCAFEEEQAGVDHSVDVIDPAFRPRMDSRVTGGWRMAVRYPAGSSVSISWAATWCRLSRATTPMGGPRRSPSASRTRR